MKQIKIINLQEDTVKGIDVFLPNKDKTYQETYFEWSPSILLAKFKTNEISGGVLRAWRHVPIFHEIETHMDTEIFYFISGVALMLFSDLTGDQPDLETTQIVRVQAGTQIIIPEGKGHFVPVAEGDEPVEIIVVSPRMGAPRISLLESVEGVV